MANLLDVGVEFESYDAFQAAIEQYENANFVQFSRIDSRSVEKAQENSVTKTYSPEIKFTQLTYACTFGPRKGPSKSTGARNARFSRKIDCPVRIRVSSTLDGQRLVIRDSKIDCHNHEISEEQYKSLSRQKQLDEETEIEIYNLVSMHEDKRLARMLIRDKLTKETGRSVSVKDILNIEKKITRKLDQEKRGQDGEDVNNDIKETEEELQDLDMDQGEEKNEDSASADEDIKPIQQVLVRNIVPATAKPAKEATPTGRPRRNRREPRRFRDAMENGDKFLNMSKNNNAPFIAPEEADESNLHDLPSSSGSKKIPVKVKEESVNKGKKRTLSNQEEPSEDETIQEKKLAIKMELLEMEKKKMKILEDIVKKLDKIIENQKKS